MENPIIDTIIDYSENVGSIEYVETIVKVRNKVHEQKRFIQKNRLFLGRELETKLCTLLAEFESTCNDNLMNLTEANYS